MLPLDNVCTIKILDEVNAVVIGLRKKEYESLYQHYALYAKGYFFNPKFKLGRWDGKIGFFSEKTGKTYFRLLPEIIPLIRKWGYKLKLIDKRTPYSMSIPSIDENYFADKGIILADHQVLAVNAAIQGINGCVEAGTGAGKTFVNGAIVDLFQKHCNFKTITIVPTMDLVKQTIKEFREKLGLDCGEYSGDKKDIDHHHVVSTWQSIQNNLILMSNFQMVVCDEAHEATGPTLQAILNEYGSHIMARIGLTGTPPDEECDARTLYVTIGEFLYSIKAAELIDKGWLAKLDIKQIILKENMKEEWKTFEERNPLEWSKTTYKEWLKAPFPDYPSERHYIETKTIRSEMIAGIIESRREREQGNCLVLVNSIKQGQKLADLIPGSILVTGSDKSKVRKEIYDSFETNNDVVMIATFKLASTGLNIPRIFYLFLIDGGKGFKKIIQSIGRGLRKALDKNNIEVIDIGSDLKYSRSHYRERKRLYEQASYNYTTKMVEYC